MLLQIDGTFLIAGLSFILFVMIMNWILYEPMMRILGEREDFYNMNSEAAAEAKSKTETILEESRQKISSTQKEAQELIKKTSESAKTKKSQTLKTAKEACGHKICDVQQTVDVQIRNVKSELHGEISNFVDEITAKVIGREMSPVVLDTQRIEQLLSGNEKWGGNV